jgi:hypothetical protein
MVFEKMKYLCHKPDPDLARIEQQPVAEFTFGMCADGFTNFGIAYCCDFSW